MAKEVLAIPEDYLLEVIAIIRAGLAVLSGGVTPEATGVTPEAEEALSDWCKREEAYMLREGEEDEG